MMMAKSSPAITSLFLSSSATMKFKSKVKSLVAVFKEPNSRYGKTLKSGGLRARKNDRIKVNGIPTLLAITLDHGDLIVMNGRKT
jgi:hypothetical protein